MECRGEVEIWLRGGGSRVGSGELKKEMNVHRCRGRERNKYKKDREKTATLVEESE